MVDQCLEAVRQVVGPDDDTAARSLDQDKRSLPRHRVIERPPARRCLLAKPLSAAARHQHIEVIGHGSDPPGYPHQAVRGQLSLLLDENVVRGRLGFDLCPHPAGCHLARLLPFRRPFEPCDRVRQRADLCLLQPQLALVQAMQRAQPGLLAVSPGERFAAQAVGEAHDHAVAHRHRAGFGGQHRRLRRG